ncbi:hypothetical protein [Pseudoplusia includens SNPV IE]|uniref:Uncharacterized protein n=1 Tax=Pseudoplusia includens SNPV IE TaxID=1592335 RepID=A0A0B4ZW56_9ABAC|nr:hypothetical protein [Pseudoplusia includens SNPV IE]AJD80697.1 hypothetical protein [Pseudoplusia includens SNPV IE]
MITFEDTDNRVIILIIAAISGINTSTIQSVSSQVIVLCFQEVLRSGNTTNLLYIIMMHYAVQDFHYLASLMDGKPEPESKAARSRRSDVISLKKNKLLRLVAEEFNKRKLVVKREGKRFVYTKAPQPDLRLKEDDKPTTYIFDKFIDRPDTMESFLKNKNRSDVIIDLAMRKLKYMRSENICSTAQLRPIVEDLFMANVLMTTATIELIKSIDIFVMMLMTRIRFIQKIVNLNLIIMMKKMRQNLKQIKQRTSVKTNVRVKTNLTVRVRTNLTMKLLKIMFSIDDYSDETDSEEDPQEGGVHIKEVHLCDTHKFSPMPQEDINQ